MITEMLFESVRSVPHWLAVILLSALPVTESRLTIPVAMLSWHMGPTITYTLAMLGNALPIAPIFFGFVHLRNWCEKHAQWAVRWLDKTIDHAHHKLGKHFEQYGLTALFLLSAIPLPGGGVWTAVFAAVALKISWKHAAPALFGGMLVMGFIVLAVTLAGGKIAS